MGRFIQSSILVLVVLTALTFFAKAQDCLPQAPSFLLKLLPQPKFEKNILEGSGENGRVIDLQGGWLNEGKLTEMVIRSKDMENKMAVCFLFRLNRAIFTVGV